MIAVQIPTLCLDFYVPETGLQALFPLELFTGCTGKKSCRSWWRSVFPRGMCSRWRWLSGLGSWDSLLERYGAGWAGHTVLPSQGTHSADFWVLPGNSQDFKFIPRNYMCRVVFFQLCQVNARPEVQLFIPLFLLPFLLQHTILQGSSKKGKKSEYTTKLLWAFSSLLPVIQTSLLKSLQLISFFQQPDSISDFICQLLPCYFPAFQLSQLSASKLLECAVYSQWKNSMQLLDSLSPPVCCFFYFIELLLLHL